MNYAHLTLTHELNVDTEKNRVINEKMIEKKVIQSDEIVEVCSRNHGEIYKTPLINISVKEQLLVLNGEKHYVLHALWKPEKV